MIELKQLGFAEMKEMFSGVLNSKEEYAMLTGQLCKVSNQKSNRISANQKHVAKISMISCHCDQYESN